MQDSPQRRAPARSIPNLQALRDSLDSSTFNAVLNVMRGETRAAIKLERGLIGLLMLSERDSGVSRERLAALEADLKRLEAA